MGIDIISLFQNKFTITEDKEIETKHIQRMLNNLSSSLPEPDLETATRLIEYNMYAETREYLQTILTYNFDKSKSGQICFLLARCCHGLNLLEEALKYLDRALVYQSGRTDYWNLQADCLLELGQWEEAASALNKSIRSSPRDAETIFRLGSIYLFNKEYGEALNCFSGCCKLNPFNSEYWEMKAEMYIKLKQISSAARCFKKAIKYGGQINLLPRLAYCYAKTGQLIKAKKLLQKSLKIDPDDVDVLYNLAGVCNMLDNNEQAYRLLIKALALNKNDPQLLNNLGYVCFRMGRSRKAIDYYREALKINPTDQNVLFNLGSCFYEKGIWEEAKATLEKLIALNKNYSEAWVLLGNVYEQLSRYKKAVDCFNKSLGLAQ